MFDKYKLHEVPLCIQSMLIWLHSYVNRSKKPKISYFSLSIIETLEYSEKVKLCYPSCSWKYSDKLIIQEFLPDN